MDTHWVHPRACGEHSVNNSLPSGSGGSSPRVRGTPGARFWSFRCRPVHPRACGEHSSSPKYISNSNGSSPRVRGTHFGHKHRYLVRRFIPARAGNTLLHCFEQVGNTVHPRACGEHVLGVTLESLRHGSSPRVRGTHDSDAFRRKAGRFIPARAGNTRTPDRSPTRVTVHPRACGEHCTQSRPT